MPKIVLNDFDSVSDKNFVKEELLPYLGVLFSDLQKRDDEKT